MQMNSKQLRETNAFSCLECGKCTGACPVARYSSKFSPRLILIRTIRNTHPDALKGPDLWSCLTCQQCQQVCPSDIDYNQFIQLVRQTVGSDNFEGTCSHGGILQSISRLMTTPKLQQNRLEWLTGDYQTSRSSDYLFFVGCLPYFDVLFEEIGTQSLSIARNSLRILNYFGIKPQVMENEKCCGHDFYWNGDLKNFQKLAESNLELLKKSKAKTIVTACPECYRTLKIDYPQLLGSVDYQVVHISEFISQQVQEKKIKLNGQGQKVTFQDPCRLGRHMGVYDAPRQVLSQFSDLEFREMAHHHHRSVCCGVTGWVNCSQVSKQIQSFRLHEAHATGADTLVTACPKCQIHFQCALLDKQLKDDVNLQVKDLTEVFGEVIGES